jgi:hypothetical protein
MRFTLPLFSPFLNGSLHNICVLSPGAASGRSREHVRRRLGLSRTPLSDHFTDIYHVLSLSLTNRCNEVIDAKSAAAGGDGAALPKTDEVLREVAPYGRATVPDHVKAELLQRIKAFIS